jgi:uncharacterized protein
MNVLLFTALISICALVAGLLGSLTGLGGGVIIVPILVMAFKVDIHYAAGASLISVIATSSGAAAAYVREGFWNLRQESLLSLALYCFFRRYCLFALQARTTCGLPIFWPSVFV